MKRAKFTAADHAAFDPAQERVNAVKQERRKLHKGDAGDYYDDKSAEADAWRVELKAAREAGASPLVIRTMEGRLEMALYVGD